MQLKKEILGIFIRSFDEKNKEFNMDLISLDEVSSTNSENVMWAIEKVRHEKDIGMEKTFCCLDGKILMSGEHNSMQRQMQNHVPYAVEQ